MLIGGFQKLTLLDYPGKVACIVFTHGCNFRCPFCHNAPLVTHAYDGFEDSEIFSYLEKRKGVLDGVVVSGGEPLLQKDIFAFLGKLKALGYAVKLDTNGSFPQKLREAIDRGLVDYVAMDIKNAAEKYADTAICTQNEIGLVEESIDILLEGRVEYEFRTTVVRELHTRADIERIAERISGARRFYLQSFIDSGNLISDGYSAYSPDEMRVLLETARTRMPKAELRGVE